MAVKLYIRHPLNYYNNLYYETKIFIDTTFDSAHFQCCT